MMMHVLGTHATGERILLLAAETPESTFQPCGRVAHLL
jgi:hypothetical protein